MYHFYHFNCYDIRTSSRYSTVLYVVIDFIEEDIRKYYATLFERQNKWSGNNMFSFFFVDMSQSRHFVCHVICMVAVISVL